MVRREATPPLHCLFSPHTQRASYTTCNLPCSGYAEVRFRAPVAKAWFESTPCITRHLGVSDSSSGETHVLGIGRTMT